MGFLSNIYSFLQYTILQPKKFMIEKHLGPTLESHFQRLRLDFDRNNVLVLIDLGLFP